jgi:integrase
VASIVRRKAAKGSRYYVVHDLIVGGQRRQKWTPAGRTQKEAQAKLAQIIGHAQKGVYVDPARTTLIDYLNATWLPAKAVSLKPSTAELYGTLVAAYVRPHDVANMPLQRVTRAHLNTLYGTLKTSGRKNGQPLAAKTIRNVHTLLHNAFEDAVDDDLLLRNPATKADLPSDDAVAGHDRRRYWTADELRRFLTATANDRLAALWLTIGSTGMRRGEALALRWSDLDLARGEASIMRTLSWVANGPTFTTPKTKKSVRVVPLRPEAVAALREHRKRQAVERLAAGSAWIDHSLVFTFEDGSPIRPGSVTKTFVRAVRDAALPPLSPHGLRHTYATVALAQGVVTAQVSKDLGHSSIAITADLYSHATEAGSRDASDSVGDAIFGTRAAVR